jgi:3'(2'), 5'-bisphosphate nucleotidase
VVAKVYATDFAVNYKGPADPVTEADRQANTLICDRLAAVFPGVPVVAEESDESAFAGWVGAERVFFVDPLDGTLEFVSKNGDFVVMIGLAERGRAVLGVVLAPALGTAWVGGEGLGAWEIARTGEKEPIHVSDVDDPTLARLVVSRSHQAESLQRVIAALGVAQVIPRGSAGLKAADVAAARADIYLQPGRAGKRWDACAPDAIVRAAGGLCTDAFGDAIAYGGPSLDNDRGLLVTNGKLHDAVLRRLAG